MEVPEAWKECWLDGADDGKLVALCKGRGYIFPGSEIYGGLANTWDYGPLGVEFKNNVKRAWWKKFVQESPITWAWTAPF